MSSAVCVKCGGLRQRYDQICPACGHRPEGDGLLIAWLLSSENLDEPSLLKVQRRVTEGESVRPSREALEQARRALGAHFATDQGLSSSQRLQLLATSFLLTPLVGWVIFFWWWQRRPRAALQALALSLPASVLFTGLVLWLR